MLGFSESFMANFPCRFCKSSKFDCNYSVICDSTKSRNEENYLQDLTTN
ncbi:C2H2-type domain-containing protein, partial [Aphis craccivora]